MHQGQVETTNPEQPSVLHVRSSTVGSKPADPLLLHPATGAAASTARTPQDPEAAPRTQDAASTPARPTGPEALPVSSRDHGASALFPLHVSLVQVLG